MQDIEKNLTIKKNLLLDWLYRQKRDVSILEIDSFLKSYLQHAQKTKNKQNIQKTA